MTFCPKKNMMSEKKSQPAICIRHLGVTFRDRNGITEALRDVSFNVAFQEFVCVLGSSGSGKTTLLRVLAGLLKPTRGQVLFSDHGRQHEVGLVFQEANLMPWRNVVDNISLPLELHGVDTASIASKTKEMIDLIGLQDFIHAWPAALSGGMAQRVAIARALIQDPELLLLDEPFGALDALTREAMGAELLRIWQTSRKTVVMVTHSISEALLLSDRVLVLSARPGTIELDLNVDIPRPRKEGVRYTPHFIALSRKLRAAIGQSAYESVGH